MTSLIARRSAAMAMATAAGLAIAGFTALGSIFDYPAILGRPTADILDSFRRSETGVRSWFLVLVVGAVLLAPVAVVLGRIAGGRRGRWITGLGIAAAAVQAIGLSRWVLLIPGISDRALEPAQAVAAQQSFDRLHLWLGVVLGETVGYALTAAFTVLVVLASAHRTRTRWMSRLGIAASALVATGVVIPLGITAAELTNFVGYIAWCVWLIATAVSLWRAPLAEISTGSAYHRSGGHRGR